jgi:hypothetical protein
MKTNVFKQLIPAGAFLLAIAGAVSTNAMEKKSKAFAVENGYERNASGTVCNFHNSCSDIDNGNMCTINQVEGNTRLWGLNGTLCTKPLFRP